MVWMDFHIWRWGNGPTLKAKVHEGIKDKKKHKFGILKKGKMVN